MQKSTIYRKPMGENLFEEEFTIEALSQMGNPLERLAALVDFEMFRPALEEVLVKKDCKTPAGRPQIDVVLMFKVIFLQRYYGLGDHQIQYQIIDRTSFRQFLGIHTVAEVPDEKTVWACKNRLAEDGIFDRLFDEFRTFLDNKGLSFNEGKIIDATFVEAPKQRNTKEENKQIKAGNGKDLWNPEEGDSEKEKKRKMHNKSHKDVDARWTKNIDWKHHNIVKLTNGKEYVVQKHKKKYILLISVEYGAYFITDHNIVVGRTYESRHATYEEALEIGILTPSQRALIEEYQAHKPTYKYVSK